MRFSRLFGNTLRQVPAEVQLPSHGLLLRAAMIRQVSAGIYDYLPLGQRVLSKIENIIREEMDRIGGQEILMPVMIPAVLWQESGRWDAVGSELVRFRDRKGADMVLGMTHEEVVTDLARKELRSHKQLPFMLYQIQTKIRDEPRSRGGLIRVREFRMKDAYSFHTEWKDLDEYYPEVYRAYDRIFKRCGLDAVVVEADPGMMGGSSSHEFMAVCDSGEDTIIRCESCDYRANLENAGFAPPEFKKDDQEAAMEEVHTPDKRTIEEVAEFVGVPVERTLKAVFYKSGDKVVFAVLRGDREVNEVKLANFLKEPNLETANEYDLEEAGIVAGFASPIDKPRDVVVIADRSIEWGANFVSGANKPDYHIKNVNYPRDFKPDHIADIAQAEPGDPCPKCGQPLKTARGIELGHIFKLGTKYSESMKLYYQDEKGGQQVVIMGCYGIGVGRLAAAVVEQHHDDYGIIWPASIAPYDVFLASLGGTETEEFTIACDVYEKLNKAGIEVLFDDRDEKAGVKFNDADLIGCPIRLTLSQRSMKKGGVEMKGRNSRDLEYIPVDNIVETVKEQKKKMEKELLKKADEATSGE